MPKLMNPSAKNLDFLLTYTKVVDYNVLINNIRLGGAASLSFSGETNSNSLEAMVSPSYYNNRLINHIYKFLYIPFLAFKL